LSYLYFCRDLYWKNFKDVVTSKYLGVGLKGLDAKTVNRQSQSNFDFFAQSWLGLVMEDLRVQ
jgi:hypothetical protein